MHGAWRGISGNGVRREDGPSTSSQRSGTSSSSDDSGHVRERFLNYRRASHRRARRTQRLWRPLSGVWTPAVGRSRAANSRTLPQRTPRQRIYGARPQIVQQQNPRRTIYEVIIVYQLLYIGITEQELTCSLHCTAHFQNQLYNNRICQNI